MNSRARKTKNRWDGMGKRLRGMKREREREGETETKHERHARTWIEGVTRQR